MGNSNKVQTRFHGGEWSEFAQGRTDDPRYLTAMNICYNSLPMKAGGWTRRGGMRLMIPSYKGLAAKVQPLAMEATASYSVEFTDQNMRFFHGALPVATNELNNVVLISTANPAVMTVAVPKSWNDGDEVLIWFTDMADSAAKQCPELRQRLVRVTPIPLTISGAWAIGTTYAQNAGVTFDGVTYISVIGGNVGNQPDTSPHQWMPLASTTGAVQFGLYDSITGDPIDGADFVFVQDQIYALRVVRISNTPWNNGVWATNRIVQQQENSFILNGAVRPQLLKITPNAGTAVFAEATLDPIFMSDGPYLDPVQNSEMSIGGLSGNISITIQFQSYDAGVTYAQGDYVSSSSIGYKSLADVNVGNTPASSPTMWEVVPLGTEVTGADWTGVPGFTSGDVGRHVRIFSQPDLWAAGSYTAGDFVLFNNVVYQAETNNSKQPDTSSDDWNVIPSGQRWVWAKVTSVTGPTTANIQIIGQPALYNTTVKIWRLGVYSDAAGWPTCGCFHEGRLWLGGAVKNRFDASMDAVALVGQGGLSPMSNRLTSFSPTLDDGTVADNCGISYTLDAQDKNNILWMNPDDQGIACGTINGEWMIKATQLSDPLTPTSIQAKRVTKYGCANIEPRRTGIALIFVQKFARRCLEFISEVFSGKYVAPDLNEYAEHVTSTGVVEIAYQEELAPVLWARKTDGTFVGSTYRRTNPSVIQPADLNGWHRHTLAAGRTCESLIVGPSADATLDTVTMVTNGTDAYGTTRWIEMMTDLFEVDTPLYDAWHVDGGMVPSSMYEDTVGGQLGVYFTGLWYLRGKTQAVFAGGLDVGDKVVDSKGRVFVPYGDGVAPTLIDYTAPGAGAFMFTAAFVASLRAQNVIPKNGGIISSGQDPITITTGTGSIPSVTQIQSYVPTNAFGTEVLPVQQDGDGMWPDFTNLLVTYQSLSNQGVLGGLRTFNMTTGAQTVSKRWNQYGINTEKPLLEVGALDFQGNITFVLGPSNYGPILTVKQSDLSQVAYNGAQASGGGSGGAIAAIAMEAFGSLTSAYGQLGPWIADSGLIGSRVDVIQNHAITKDEFGFAESGVGWLAPINSDVLMGFHAITQITGTTTGPVGYYGQFITIQNQVDAVYLGQHATMDSKKGKGKKKFQLNQNDIFRGGNAGSITSNLKRIGDITPAMIDSLWTHFTQEGGVVTDQIDNGTIAFFKTNDQLAQPYRGASSAVTFNGASTYAAYGLVTYAITGSNTNYYMSLVGSNVGNTPTNSPADTNWKLFATSTAPTWAVGTTYAQYDIVVLAGIYYRSNAAGNVGNDPSGAGAASWTAMNQGYTINERVTALDGFVYKSKQNNNFNHSPSNFANNSFWGYDTEHQTSWLVKFAKTTTAILWKVPLPNTQSSNAAMARGKVSGTFVFISPSQDFESNYPIYAINTQTGAYFVGKLPAVAINTFNNVQIFDSASYSIFLNIGNYDSAASGAPTPLNSTASFSTVTQCRLFIGQDLVPHTHFPSTGPLPTPKPVISIVNNPVGQFPCVVGTPFTSQGQMLRAGTQEDVKSVQGPGLAKTRRSHYLGLLVKNAVGLKIGVDFTTTLTKVTFTTKGNRQYQPDQVYSGVTRETLKGDYDFDSMPAWEVSRPYPLAVLAAGPFLKAQDV